MKQVAKTDGSPRLNQFCLQCREIHSDLVMIQLQSWLNLLAGHVLSLPGNGWPVGFMDEFSRDALDISGKNPIWRMMKDVKAF